MNTPAPDPERLDLTLYASFLADEVSARVLARLRAAGHRDIRVSHGFLFQLLLTRPHTVGEAAAALQVTPQAVSKLVAQLEQAGYVARSAGGKDARFRSIELTARGLAVIEAARACRAEIVAQLAQRIGAARLDAATAVLREALEALDVMPNVRARRLPLRPG